MTYLDTLRGDAQDAQNRWLTALEELRRTRDRFAETRDPERRAQLRVRLNEQFAEARRAAEDVTDAEEAVLNEEETAARG